MKNFISTLALTIMVLVATVIATPLLGAEETGYFRLNANPENPNRQPDWRTEEGVVLSKDSPVIVIGGGNGKRSTGRLPAGVLVMTDKTTGEATWVAICGNRHISPARWKPDGKRITAVLYKQACDEMQEMLLRMEKLQQSINILLSRPVSVTSGEVKGIVEQAMLSQDRYNGWCGIWTDTGCYVLAGVVVGGTAYLLTRDKKDDDKGVPPGGSTGPAFFGATVTPRVRVIPPSNGRGGGFFIGGSLSM